MDRRSFNKIVLGACSLAASGCKTASENNDVHPLRWVSKTPGNKKWVMVIDLAKCDGCGDCTKACNKMHFVPPMQEWIRVIEMKDNPAAGTYFLPKPCMHCDNPPCVRACPVGATFKQTDGIVMMDQDRCIGCRNCIIQCPYGARSFNWTEPPHTPEELSQPYTPELNYPHRKGVVEKCILCPSMLNEGHLPACASACTMGAIWVGDEYEDAVTNGKGETVKYSELVERGGAEALMGELGTKPRVLYLPPANRKYDSPDKKREKDLKKEEDKLNAKESGDEHGHR